MNFNLFCRYVNLDISSGVGEIGGIRWPLLGCLAICWVAVFLCLFKGLKSAGKVAYVTVISPYIFLTILLVRGLMLPGAIDGILFFVWPDFSRLISWQVLRNFCFHAFINSCFERGERVPTQIKSKLRNY